MISKFPPPRFLLYSVPYHLVSPGCFLFVSFFFFCEILSVMPHISMVPTVCNWRAWIFGSLDLDWSSQFCCPSCFSSFWGVSWYFSFPHQFNNFTTWVAYFIEWLNKLLPWSLQLLHIFCHYVWFPCTWFLCILHNL